MLSELWKENRKPDFKSKYAVKKTEEKIIRYAESQALISPGDAILVALSGGPDSVLLLSFLDKFKKKFKIEIAAFHLNHKLRGRSADLDERFCRKFCSDRGIKYFSQSKDVKAFAAGNKLSVEEAGRNLRYDLLNRICTKYHFTKIATAHIKDDNTETVLLNIMKGSGITGITGIPPKRNNIIRPLLCLSKDEVLDYLHSGKINYRIDESNLSDDYERNFIRNKLIPLVKERLNPSLDDTIYNSSSIFSHIKNYLDSSVKKEKKRVVTAKSNGLIINLDMIPGIHFAILSEILRNSIQDTWNIKTGSADIQKISDLINKQSGTILELSDNLTALKNRKQIIIQKKLPVIETEKRYIKIGNSINLSAGRLSIKQVDAAKIKFSSNSLTEYISADRIKGRMSVRNWKPGDSFVPFGMTGRKKLSDYLVDIKQSKIEKQGQLVLTYSEQIIWVIGKRLDNRFKINNTTKNILELSWKPKKN